MSEHDHNEEAKKRRRLADRIEDLSRQPDSLDKDRSLLEVATQAVHVLAPEEKPAATARESNANALDAALDAITIQAGLDRSGYVYGSTDAPVHARWLYLDELTEENRPSKYDRDMTAYLLSDALRDKGLFLASHPKGD